MRLDYIFRPVMVAIIKHSHYKECHIHFQFINRNLLRHVKTMWSIKDIIECNVQASMWLLIYISIQQWEDSNYTFCGLTDFVINTILCQCWLCGSISMMCLAFPFHLFVVCHCTDGRLLYYLQTEYMCKAPV
jgi:hypothetical protein